MYTMRSNPLVQASVVVTATLAILLLRCTDVCSGQQEGVAFLDRLNGTAVPPANLSQCGPTTAGFCDDSSPGTGHERFWSQSLADHILLGEQCYSLCFSSNFSSRGVNFTTAAFPEVYNLGCNQAYVCLAACVMRDVAVRTALQLSTGATCLELCNATGGICDIATYGISDPQCSRTCQSQLCPMHCETSFSVQLPAVGDAVESAPTHPVVLSYPESSTLSEQGVVEFSLSGKAASSSGLAEGIIWRVQFEENNTQIEYYFSQHLPFLLSPAEVGPLYRAGSNAMAIQQLQCRQGLQLSYALVSQQGRTNFSQPTAQCFFGNSNQIPEPPSGVAVDYGFSESGELRLIVSARALSPDQAQVTGYGLQVFTRLANGSLQFNARKEFPSRNDLLLDINGTEAVAAFLPTYKVETTYLFGVFSLPQIKNKTSSGETLHPFSTWVEITTGLPPIPSLDGSACYSFRRNHSSGLADVTVQYRVSSGNRSLAAITTLDPSLTVFRFISIPFPGRTLPPRKIPARIASLDPIAARLSATVYTFDFLDFVPILMDRQIEFAIQLSGRYISIQDNRHTRVEFNIFPVAPSVVRGLVACYQNLEGNAPTVNVSWQPPQYPEGVIRSYEVQIADQNNLGTIKNTTTGTFYVYTYSRTNSARNINVTVFARSLPQSYLTDNGDVPGEEVAVVFSAPPSEGSGCTSAEYSSASTAERLPEDIDGCGLFAAQPTLTTPSSSAMSMSTTAFFVTLIALVFSLTANFAVWH